jgi:two-component system, LytTR family, response regulator
MILKCVIVDDEPLAIELLKQYIKKFAILQLIQTFTDAVKAREYLQTNKPDLLLIDINMPDITGVELVRSLIAKPMVVFTTAYKQFAIDGYDLDAIDYLLKPIEFERFEKAVHKAAEFYNYKKKSLSESEALFVRSEYQLVKINLNDIEYIESAEDYLKIHLLGMRPVMTLMTLKSMLEKLPAEKFKRIHRSYVIPVSRVVSINNKKIKLPGVELPIGDNYAAVVQELISGV